MNKQAAQSPYLNLSPLEHFSRGERAIQTSTDLPFQAVQSPHLNLSPLERFSEVNRQSKPPTSSSVAYKILSVPTILRSHAKVAKSSENKKAVERT